MSILVTARWLTLVAAVLVLALSASSGTAGSAAGTSTDHPPFADAGGPYIVEGGQSLQLDASDTFDLDVIAGGDSLSYSWRFDAIGVAALEGVRPTVSWAQLGPLAAQPGTWWPIELTVTDRAGLQSVARTQVQVLPTVEPLVAAGGPYVLAVGDDLVLSAGSEDPEGTLPSTAFSWDLNDDGSTDVVGRSPTVSWSLLNAYGLVRADPFTHRPFNAVALTITSPDGSTRRVETTLTVYGAQPVAVISGPWQAYAGTDVSFSAHESYHQYPGRAIRFYHWDFGDGTTADGADVSHTFVGAGVREVRLEVMDAEGHTATATRSVDVFLDNHPPVADAGGPYSVTIAGTLQLDGSGSTDVDLPAGDSLTYAWDVNGDGVADATGVRPTLTARQMADLGLGVGAYTVRLTVSDAAGLTGTDTAALTLLYGEFSPVAVATATPLTVPAGCTGAGGTVTFSAAGSYEEGTHRIVLYQWIYNVPVPDPLQVEAAFNAGGVDFQTTDGAVQPSHVYQQPGIYNAALRVLDDNAETKSAIAVIRGITVVGPPNEPPVAEAGGPYAVGLGEGLVLDGSGTTDPNVVCGDSLYYAWDVDGDGKGDVAGLSPTITAAKLTALGIGAGEHVITLTVSDSGRLVSRDTATLTIAEPDTTPPTFRGLTDLTVEATGPRTPLVPTLPTATDAVDGNVPVVCDAPAAFPLGETTVHCSAEDRAGNRATASFTVTVVDTTPPRLAGLPTDQTVAATGPTGAVVTYAQPTAVDLVDGAVDVHCQPTSGSLVAVGQTTVQCSAKDSAGNEAPGSFRVTVTPYADTVKPVLVVPDALTVDATASWGAVVTYTATASDDRDGNLTPTCSRASGTRFPIGTTTVTCTVSDTAGNTATAEFAATVRGAVPQLADLRDAVKGVGPGKSLEVKAGLALAAATTGHHDLASTLLVPFIAEAKAQSGRTIPKTTADELLADAQRIRAVLG